MDTALVKGAVEGSSYKAFGADIFEPPRQLPSSPSAGSVSDLVGMQL